MVVLVAARLCCHDAVFITNPKFFSPRLEIRILNPAGRLAKVFGEEKLYQ